MNPNHPHRRRRANVALMMFIASLVMLTVSAQLNPTWPGNSAFASEGTRGARAETGGIAGNPIPYTWGVIGSSGTPDESSADKVSFSGPIAQMTSNGSATLRYNVTAADGFATTLADGFTFWIRMRDNGSAARVRVWFKACSIVTGESQTIAVYDSNALPASPNFELDAVDICGFTWDFYNYLYYIEVRLERTSSAGKPAIGALQISELYCE